MSEQKEQLGLAQSLRNAERLVKAISNLVGAEKEMQGRNGAYFCKSDADGIPIFTALVGQVARIKRQKYKNFSEEKGRRAALLFKYAGHRLSRQSLDEELEYYTGAVRASNFGFSISGYPSDVDEMGSIGWAVLERDISSAAATAWAKGNSYSQKLQALLFLD